MAQVTVYRCDECDAERGEKNHWYALFADNERFSLHRWAEVDPDQLADAMHLCGPGCVQRRVQRFLEAAK